MTYSNGDVRFIISSDSYIKYDASAASSVVEEIVGIEKICSEDAILNPHKDKHKKEDERVEKMRSESQIREKVFVALGEVSMCWGEIPRGEFNSTHAQKIGNDLVNYLLSNDEQFRSDVLGLISFVDNKAGMFSVDRDLYNAIRDRVMEHIRGE